MKDYHRQQIIKHALQHYIQRPNATEKDIAQEKRLLNEIEQDIISMKKEYGIELSEKEKELSE